MFDTCLRASLMAVRMTKQPVTAVQLARWDWTYPHNMSPPQLLLNHISEGLLLRRLHACVQTSLSSTWEQRILEGTLGGSCPFHFSFLHTLAEQLCRQNNVQCSLLLLPHVRWTKWFPRFVFMFECNLLHNIKQCHHLKSLIGGFTHLNFFINLFEGKFDQYEAF